MGPTTFRAGDGLAVPPHPHTGIQTVTWLFEGAALHRDSLGSEQLIRPRQLNLMTAGAGIAHSEEDPDGSGGTIQGVQLWVAQPAATRAGGSSFEHLTDLPRVHLDHGTATVLVGQFDGALSPARRDTDHVGVELDLRRGTTVVPLDPAYEHGLVVASDPSPWPTPPCPPAPSPIWLPGADELALTADGAVVALLLGGVPFPEEVSMWWNFVARTRDELADAYRDWVDGSDRFGPVTSALPRVDRETTSLVGRRLTGSRSEHPGRHGSEGQPRGLRRS